MTVTNYIQPQQPNGFYRETDLVVFPSEYGPQFIAPQPPQLTGNIVKTKKSHKKKKKKKQRDSSDEDEGSDEDNAGSSIAVYTKQNGRRVVVVPENTSVMVRPHRNTPRIVGPGPYEGQPHFAPGGVVPIAGNDVIGDQWVDPRGGIGGQPWRGNEYLDPVNTIYESRIVPGSGGFVPPEVGLDPFVDEGPYERRLPVSGYGVEPGIYRPDPRNFVEFPEHWMPTNTPIPESNFILRPSDMYGRPLF